MQPTKQKYVVTDESNVAVNGVTNVTDEADDGVTHETGEID